ncbi:MAG: CDP-glucose 4,6-dehydratase [Terrimicrobiaceae bacterium]
MFNRIYSGKRVLVTGHTGFKGSWLSLWLRELGAEVAGYSLGSVGSHSHFDLIGLQGQMEHFTGDVRDRTRLFEVFQRFQPEFVFHMAAQALVKKSYNDPASTFEVNAMGMVNVMECLRNSPSVRSALMITSDKAYRNDEWCWGYRECDALAGHDPYSASKSCADLIAQSYWHSFFKTSPIRVAIARAGNVIGGGDWAEDRIVPDCMRALARGEQAVVRNPGATRPWQHVLEPLSGYLHLAARLAESEKDLHGEAFNFGPDATVNHSVGELLAAMAQRWPELRWDAPPGTGKREHEATLLKLNCDKALFYLQWKPVLEFFQTVELTVDWYREWSRNRISDTSFSSGQIRQYCALAKDRDAVWMKT